MPDVQDIDQSTSRQGQPSTGEVPDPQNLDLDTSSQAQPTTSGQGKPSTSGQGQSSTQELPDNLKDLDLGDIANLDIVKLVKMMGVSPSVGPIDLGEMMLVNKDHYQRLQGVGT